MRTARAVVAVWAAVVLALLCMWTRSVAGGRPEDKPRLAVLDFFPAEHTDRRLTGPLADKVSEALQSTGQYRLVDRNSIAQRLTERDWANTSLVDQARKVTQVSKELDAAWIVWGRYVDMGRVWSMSLFIVNVSTGEQAGVVTEDVSGAPEGLSAQLLQVAPQAAHRLLMQAGKKTGPIVITTLPDVPPVTLPPMPAGTDELDARCRQVQAIHAEPEKLRETHTEKHPHVVFFREQEEALAKALAPDVKKAIAQHEGQYAQMAEYYKPNHPAMQALQRRLSDLQGLLAVVGPPKELVVDLGGGVTMKMVLIQAGTFTMGSPASEKDRDDDEVQHEVTISKPFYMGVTEVTQVQWEAVMGNNRSHFKGRDLPVETVSWKDCQQFFGKLNGKVRGGGFRLATEAEWEYACRAGTKTRFHSGDADADLDAVGWYNGNSGGRTHPVGEKKPNAWGLYDMHGNVWEWCADWYGDYPRGRVTDPAGPGNGTSRVVRGGGWDGYPGLCRAALRDWLTPEVRVSSLGVRVVRTVLPPTP